MATPQEHAPSVITLEQFEQIMRTLVSEIRKPPFDPVKEIQKKREQETKLSVLAAYWKNKEEKKKRCSHRREDGTCLIAWATQSDNIERGYCPNCDSTFFPEDGEIYQKVRLIPRGRRENVRYV
jgi:hypothetical protein